VLYDIFETRKLFIYEFCKRFVTNTSLFLYVVNSNNATLLLHVHRLNAFDMHSDNTYLDSFKLYVELLHLLYIFFLQGEITV